MEAHKAEVERIAIKVQEFYNKQQRFRIYHGSSNSTRTTVGKLTNVVDTSRLNGILGIDSVSKIAVVQANVAMDALLEETLKHDLMPLVVTEFPGITVGGAFSGTAGESSSFKHEFFDRTVSEIEMVLANGEVVECSENENADVFRGAPGALGTLGVVTLLHVRLQKAARYVEVTYHPVKDSKEAVEKLQNFATQEDSGVEYLDGIMFSATKGAVITGRLTDSNPLGLKSQRFIRPTDLWYFMHVESCISSNSQKSPTELVPLPDYVFRYNRGTFWCSKAMFDLFGIKFTNSTWRMFDRLMTARMSYQRLHQQEVTTALIQDIAVPFPAAEEFIKWLGGRFEVWPLWLCPLRVSPMPTLHPHPLRPDNAEDQTPHLMLNVGVYDVWPKYYEDWIVANRDLEDKVTELGGMKWAYAAQMYSEDRFWEQHDRAWYDRLREKCHATSLPTIFDKTKVDLEAGRKVLEKQAEERKRGWKRSLGSIVDYIDGLDCVWKSFRSGAWKLERSPAWKDWPKM